MRMQASRRWPATRWSWTRCSCCARTRADMEQQRAQVLTTLRNVAARLGYPGLPAYMSYHLAKLVFAWCVPLALLAARRQQQSVQGCMHPLLGVFLLVCASGASSQVLINLTDDISSSFNLDISPHNL